MNLNQALAEIKILKAENKKLKDQLYEMKRRKKQRKYKKEWYKKNKAKKTVKVEINQLAITADLIRSKTWFATKQKSFTARSRFAPILGCTPLELRAYLESKFKEGMSWGNQGQWHIDHVKALASAKNEEELIQLAHYTNLQPLWAKDNLAKAYLERK